MAAYGTRADDALLRSGDPEDFGRFYDRHVHAVLGYLERSARDPAAALAGTAETFAVALLRRRRFRAAATAEGAGAGSATAWLYAIADREGPRAGRRRSASARLGCRPTPGERIEVALRTLRRALVDAARRETGRSLPRPSALPRGALAGGLLVLVAAALVVAVRGGSGGPAAAPAPAAAAVRPLFGGSLEAGMTYATRALVPSLTLRVDDGRWSARQADLVGLLVLERRRPTSASGIEAPPQGVLSFARPAPVYDPDVHDLERSLSPAPRDRLAWLRRHPDVRAGRPHPARLAGHDGRMLDLTFRFRRPRHPAPACRFTGVRCSALAPDDFHVNGERMRVYDLRTAAGPLIVAVSGINAAAFWSTMAHATRVLSTLRIGGA